MNNHVQPPVQIAENIWQFNEANENGPYVDAYLIVGTERALLVDALQTVTGLYEEIRKITPKPLSVFITHGHLDHAGVAVEELHQAGVPIYMSHLDYPLLKEMMDYGHGPDWFLDLTPGMVFDLGGFCFETISLDGHSRGSMAALDKERQLLFSGDAIGGGGLIWMQLPCCSPLVRLKESLEALRQNIRQCPQLLVYPGHRNQSPVQLTGQYIEDLFFIVQGLLDRSLQGEPSKEPWQGDKLEFHREAHGVTTYFCYDPERLYDDN